MEIKPLCLGLVLLVMGVQASHASARTVTPHGSYHAKAKAACASASSVMVAGDVQANLAAVAEGRLPWGAVWLESSTPRVSAMATGPLYYLRLPKGALAVQPACLLVLHTAQATACAVGQANMVLVRFPDRAKVVRLAMP
ncbi:hypothetical protein E3E12_01205 [Formicincola oecophyllae]|uniref:Uncharacterized protein n=1 Tax=Formicincola oecophyllae TaxID=2558361 RepID=A0A4Y6U8Z7_9PROT|nr:hypothetical protein [Formicincola oecophyllae]QDH13038.1 hypothetical protein E3E12_01205 [Formicincola oecophyllae]